MTPRRKATSKPQGDRKDPAASAGRRPNGRVTIRDVADQAGVSLGTASNVLNRPEVVAPDTLARVLAVIDRLRALEV